MFETAHGWDTIGGAVTEEDGDAIEKGNIRGAAKICKCEEIESKPCPTPPPDNSYLVCQCDDNWCGWSGIGCFGGYGFDHQKGNIESTKNIEKVEKKTSNQIGSKIGGDTSALTRAGRTEESQTGLTTSTGTQSAPSDASTSTLTTSIKSSTRISPLRRITSISPIGGATSILNPNNTVSTLVNLLVLASFAIGLIYVFKHD